MIAESIIIGLSLCICVNQIVNYLEWKHIHSGDYKED